MTADHGNDILRSLVFVFIIFQVLHLIATLSGLPTDTTYDPATDRSYTSAESSKLGLSLWALSFAFGYLYYRFRAHRRQKREINQL